MKGHTCIMNIGTVTFPKINHCLICGPEELLAKGNAES
jgi:hypothetical protein